MLKEYDDRGNLIYIEYFDGYKYRQEFDKNNNVVHYKNSNKEEYWYKYIEGERISITKKEFEQIKSDEEYQEFISREPVSRFNLMDI